MINEICDASDSSELESTDMCSKTKLNNLNQVVIDSRNARNFILKYYADTIVSTASNYEKNTINEQAKATQFILQSSGKANMSDYLKLYLKHINQYIVSGKIEQSVWLQTCNEIKGRK